RTGVRGQAPKGVGRGSAAPDQDDRAEAEGQEPEGGHGGQPLGRGHGQRGGGGQAGQEQRGGGGPDQDVGQGRGLEAAAPHGPADGQGDAEPAGRRRLDRQPAPEHRRARGPCPPPEEVADPGEVPEAEQGGGPDGHGLAAAGPSRPSGQLLGQRGVPGVEGDGGTAGQVLATDGGVAGRAVGRDQGQFGGERPGQQVGGGEQAQGFGAALGVVGGAVEAGHPLADPAGGHVLAAGLDKLVRSHRAPPTVGHREGGGDRNPKRNVAHRGRGTNRNQELFASTSAKGGAVDDGGAPPRRWATLPVGAPGSEAR